MGHRLFGGFLHVSHQFLAGLHFHTAMTSAMRPILETSPALLPVFSFEFISKFFFSFFFFLKEFFSCLDLSLFVFEFFVCVLIFHFSSIVS